MGEILMPLSIDDRMAKNVYIVIITKVAQLDVKQSMVIQNHDVVHYIYFLTAIKP